MLASALAATAVSAQPLVHWQLDEGSGSTAADSAVGQRDADLLGSPTWLPVGIVGGGARFDGVADHGVVAGAAGPDLAHALTLAAWVRPSTVEGIRALVSKDGAYELELGHAGSGSYSVRLSNLRRGAGNTSVVPGTWQHLAVTWDGATIRYYFDGVADGTFAWAGPLSASSRQLAFAGRPPSYGFGVPEHLYAGGLDDVRVYDRALAAHEIAALHALADAPEDVAAPVRSLGQPTGSILRATSSVTLRLVTDEAAECRYDAAPGVDFALQSQVFQETGGLVHETPIVGLVDDTAYAFYVRCRDSSLNANGDDYLVSFVTDGNPAGDGIAPIVFGGTPVGHLPAGTGQALVAVSTHIDATCRYAFEGGVPYAAMPHDFQSTGGTAHSTPVTVDDGSSPVYFVRCRDVEGDANSADHGVAFTVADAAPAGFHPTDLVGNRFFVESRFGLTAARCSAPECLAAGDQVEIGQQYCDLENFPHGCVRRWQDQSAYAPESGFDPPEWIGGRDFGQDDSDKPGLVPDCLNGLPCVRGGLGASQPRQLEIEPEQPVGPFAGAWSVYLVARPVAQPEEWHYFGFAGTELRHRPSDDALRLRVGFGSPVTVTPPGAVTPGAWHLIEIHRDDQGHVRAVVDGEDVTLGSPMISAGFRFRFLMSVSRLRSMFGDMAAALVVEGPLGPIDEARTRLYFAELYGLTLAGSDAHLLAEWTFDDAGSCTLANTAPGPDAVAGPSCPSNAPAATAGRVGPALDFFFNGHEVVAGSDPALDSLQGLTISAWVRTQATTGWRSVLDKRDSTDDGFDLYLAPGGKPFVRVDSASVEASGSIADGQWHHLAATYNGHRLELWVDGESVGDATAVGLHLDTQAPLVLGRHFLAGFGQWAGALDQVRIWDGALLPVEILALAREGQP